MRAHHAAARGARRRARRCRSRSATTSGIAEPPGEQFGKLMSLPDELMPRYFTLTTGWHPDRIDEVTGALADGSLAPVDAKRLLARTVVDLYHGDGAGDGGRGRVRPGVPRPRGARPRSPSS